MNNVSQKELYEIFNNVLSRGSLLEYERIDQEISLFCKKFDERRQNNPQLDIFEEKQATPQDVKNVQEFCKTLKSYYREMDDDNYTDGCLSEDFYRYMYESLESCKPYVFEENQDKYKTIKRDIQRYLPEYKDKIIIEDYIKEAEEVYKIRQKSQKSKENRETEKAYCERLAVHFFNKIKQDNNLREMKHCPEMLVLCEKVLQIVDCLPQNKFGRIKKYEMKRNINKSRENIAKSLGGAYEGVAKVAILEQKKYENAIETTKQYIENTQKHRPRVPTLEQRNRKAQEEFYWR